MRVFSFLTLASLTEGSHKEKGIKFLAFAYPVRSEEEVKAHMEVLKKEYYDARHLTTFFICNELKYLQK